MSQIQSKRSVAIASELEAMILEGSLAEGQRLPAERELAQRFNVSRPSVREAIQLLETKGLLSRRHGGGTYVENTLAKGFADPLFELLTTRPEAQDDLLEFRHALEGIAAFYATQRATETDVTQIRATQHILQEVIGVGDIQAEAEATTQLYMAIAEASHNLVLLHLIRAVQPLLQHNILSNIDKLHQRAAVIAEIRTRRNALIDAILNGHAEQARCICDDHLAFIKASLRDIQFEEQRIQRSLRRIQPLGE